MSVSNLSHALSMIRLCMGYIPTRVIYVAAKLGIADLIADDGTSARVLAEKLDVHPDALYRVLRTLAGLGVLHQDENDLFFLTSFGETLRKDSPLSVRDFAIYSHEIVYEIFSNITESVRTGEPVIDNFYAYLQANPEEGAVFRAAMANQGRVETAAIIETYDFSNCRSIVDVGGGDGALLSSILTSYEHVSGILFDEAPAIAVANSGKGGPLPRCVLVTGDFFDGVPSDGDTYILKRVLCDWPEEEAVRILKNCRKVMPDDGRLLVIEPLIGPANEQSLAHLYDMAFLVEVRGHVRTEEEHTTLLGQAGFRLKQNISTASAVSVLETFAD